MGFDHFLQVEQGKALRHQLEHHGPVFDFAAQPADGGGEDGGGGPTPSACPAPWAFPMSGQATGSSRPAARMASRSRCASTTSPASYSSS